MQRDRTEYMAKWWRENKHKVNKEKRNRLRAEWRVRNLEICRVAGRLGIKVTDARCVIKFAAARGIDLKAARDIIVPCHTRKRKTTSTQHAGAML